MLILKLLCQVFKIFITPVLLSVLSLGWRIHTIDELFHTRVWSCYYLKIVWNVS
jgi:hypothetical protein